VGVQVLPSVQMEKKYNKQNVYTLKYKTQLGGKTKTMTTTYTNLKEARKAGMGHFDNHISLTNEKGTSLPL
jgi:hypothetical protein